MDRKGYKSDYLTRYLHPEEGSKYIKKAIKVLRKYDKEYDTIAFTGASGALFGPELSRRLNKHLIVVRKNIDDCHSCEYVEGYYNVYNYIIVDDFVASGKTVRTIQEKIEKEISDEARCIGILEMSDLRGYGAKKDYKLNKEYAHHI